MAVKPVKAYGFNGMNNLPEAPAYLLDDKRRITPRVILNAEVTDGGAIQPRGGYVSQQDLVGLHSLAGEESGLSVMLGVAQGVLYRLDANGAVPLATVTGPRARMCYAEVNNTVYMSNPFWNGAYDLLTGIVRSWGVELPGVPEISLVPGDLPPGRYSLAYTNYEDGRLGGNGPPAQITWEGDSQGIQLGNFEAGQVCWITHPNGGQLFLAVVNNQDQITSQAPQAKPLMTQGVIPPPKFTHFCQAHGRIWGVNGRNLYCSEPNEFGDFGWFSRKYIPFLDELVMVAPQNDGLYLHSRKSSWCLMGTEPGKMVLKRVGNGAIPGSLVMAQMPANIAGGAATSQVFANQSKMPNPVWMAPSGVVVGTHGSPSLTHLTEGHLHINPRSQGASLYRLRNGIPQIISTLYGSPSREDGDQDLESIFARGRLYGPEPVNIISVGGVVVGG